MPIRDDAVWNPQPQIEHLDLEQIARLGAVDRDRSGYDVRTVRYVVVLDLSGDNDGISEYVAAVNAMATEVRDRALIFEHAFVGHGVDADDPRRRRRSSLARRSCSAASPSGLSLVSNASSEAPSIGPSLGCKITAADYEWRCGAGGRLPSLKHTLEGRLVSLAGSADLVGVRVIFAYTPSNGEPVDGYFEPC